MVQLQSPRQSSLSGTIKFIVSYRIVSYRKQLLNILSKNASINPLYATDLAPTGRYFLQELVEIKSELNLAFIHFAINTAAAKWKETCI